MSDNDTLFQVPQLSKYYPEKVPFEEADVAVVAVGNDGVDEDVEDDDEVVDGAPDIFPHSHNFHVPFFITIIRDNEEDTTVIFHGNFFFTQTWEFPNSKNATWK